jgi:ADP-ribosylglycohydrolase
MKEVIHSGGDTDTNACIVGGLIGSILGVTNLPI